MSEKLTKTVIMERLIEAYGKPPEQLSWNETRAIDALAQHTGHFGYATYTHLVMGVLHDYGLEAAYSELTTLEETFHELHETALRQGRGSATEAAAHAFENLRCRLDVDADLNADDAVDWLEKEFDRLYHKAEQVEQADQPAPPEKLTKQERAQARAFQSLCKTFDIPKGINVDRAMRTIVLLHEQALAKIKAAHDELED